MNIQFWLVIRGWDESTASESSEYSVPLLSCQNLKFTMEIFLIFPSTSSRQTFLSVFISTKSRSFRHFLPIVFPYSRDLLADRLHKSYLFTLVFEPSCLSLFIDASLCCQEAVEFLFAAAPTHLALGAASFAAQNQSSQPPAGMLAFVEERAGVLVEGCRITAGKIEEQELAEWMIDGPFRWLQRCPAGIKHMVGVDFSRVLVGSREGWHSRRMGVSKWNSMGSNRGS